MKHIAIFLMFFAFATICKSYSFNQVGHNVPVDQMKESAQPVTITTTAQENQQVPKSVMKLTRKLGFGWNLGNHFDSSVFMRRSVDSRDNWWDRSTPTETLYQSLAKAGIKTVRIPVTWGSWQGKAPDYTIDSLFMALVRKNVLWAKKAGLNVVLNTHHDEYWLDAFTASQNDSINRMIKARIAVTWKQIANVFRDEGHYLILEPFNELNHRWAAATDGELDIMNQWNQLAVDVIRATGGKNANRWIAVPSYQASHKYALNDAFKLPEDKAKRLIVEVHSYDPYDFTIHAVDSKDQHSDLYRTTWGTDADREELIQMMSRLKARFIDKGIPCYLDEFGCSMHKTPEANICRENYLKFFCKAAHEVGIPVCLWDNANPGEGAEHHSYISHNDGSWMQGQESLVRAMIDEY